MNGVNLKYCSEQNYIILCQLSSPDQYTEESINKKTHSRISFIEVNKTCFLKYGSKVANNVIIPHAKSSLLSIKV